MKQLTDAQKLEIMDTHSDAQHSRAKEVRWLGTRPVERRSEASATLSLIKHIDTYLKQIEGKLATDNNPIYSAQLCARDQAVERFMSLTRVEVTPG